MMKIYVFFLMVSVMPSLVALTAGESNLAHNCKEALVMHLGIQISKVSLLKIFQNDTDTAIGSYDGRKGNWSTVSEHKGRLSFGTAGNEIKISLNNLSSFASYKCAITFNTGTFTITDWNVTFYGKLTEPISEKFTCRHTQVDCYVLDESFTCIQQPTSNTIYTENDNNQVPINVVIAVAVTVIVIGAVCLIFCCLRKRKQKKNRERKTQDKENQEKAPHYTHVDRFGSVHLKENPRRLKPFETTQPLIEESNE